MKKVKIKDVDMVKNTITNALLKYEGDILTYKRISQIVLREIRRITKDTTFTLQESWSGSRYLYLPIYFIDDDGDEDWDEMCFRFSNHQPSFEAQLNHADNFFEIYEKNILITKDNIEYMFY